MPPIKVLLTGLLVFLFTLLVLFTWFGKNWGVYNDMIQAIPRFAARASGEGHEKPFWYYAKLLVGGWSGAVLVLLALVGTYQVLKRWGRNPGAADLPSADAKKLPQSALGFIFAAYSIGIFVVYSLIPYKTPWLALNFWLPLALMAGVAIDSLWFTFLKLSSRVALSVFLVLVGCLMAHDTWQRVFVGPADAANPYAYAHTVDDLLGLPKRLAELSLQEHLADPRIAVVAADPWPLPWYLRQYSQVGFWQPGQAPGPVDFFITSPEAAEKMSGWLTHFRPEYFGLRPEVLIILWVPETQGKSP